MNHCQIDQNIRIILLHRPKLLVLFYFILQQMDQDLTNESWLISLYKVINAFKIQCSLHEQLQEYKSFLKKDGYTMFI